jgi:hypothetical protein
LPDFIVIHAKYDSFALHGLDDRVINPESDFEKDQRKNATNEERT